MTENETTVQEEVREDEGAEVTGEPCESPATPDITDAESDLPDEENAEGIRTSAIDYEALAREDLEILRGEFSDLEGVSSLAELDNPIRYGELRDLGLSPREAYLATAMPKRERARAYDNRSHLRSSVPKSHGGRVDTMRVDELREARELFEGMSDAEIVRLYKKVNS